jgi:hypothetical protein
MHDTLVALLLDSDRVHGDKLFMETLRARILAIKPVLTNYKDISFLRFAKL